MRRSGIQLGLSIISLILLLTDTPISIIAQQPPSNVRSNRSSLPPAHTRALTDWHDGRIDKLVLNFRYLSPQQQAELAKQHVSDHIKIGDFLTHGKTGLGDIIIKREVVNGLEELTGRIRQTHPDATLQWASGYRSPFQQQGTGSTARPHVRGNAVDVIFSIPGKSSEESAKILAQQARELGVKGIAIDKNASTESYSCHLDFVRKDAWYVKQVWVTDEKTKRQRAVYKQVDTSTWELPGVETAEQARERNELLQVKALVDKGAINRDALNPKMRRMLEQFEATQKIIGDSIRSKSGKPSSQMTVLKSDGSRVPLNSNTSKGKAGGTRAFLSSHPDLHSKVLAGDLPPEAKSKPIEVTDGEVQDESQIPHGWHVCNCPGVHLGLGLLFKGVRYHAWGYTCP